MLAISRAVDLLNFWAVQCVQCGPERLSDSFVGASARLRTLNWRVSSVRRTMAQFVLLTVVSGVPVAQVRAATDLITKEEASRPDAAVPKGHLGGVTRSPVARLLEPQGPVRAPFRLVIGFEAYGGATIASKGVRVTYHKIPPVELTHRLKEAVSSEGIDLADANAPAGKHVVRVELEDSNGKQGVHYLTLEVLK